jgi:predicted metal-binding transcription factor (methanogenesis marker protein 9)
MVHAIDIVKPYVNELLSLLYKNKFHASYPIRNSAQITWNQAIETMNISDQEFLTNLTPQLVSYLLSEAEIENYEVREIVFKGKLMF